MARRYYSATAKPVRLNGQINESTTTVVVNSLSGYPATTPYIIIVDDGTSSEEVMLVTAQDTSVNSLTVVRGYDDTDTYAHADSASVKHGFSAIDFREANTYINTAKTWGNLKDGS